MKYNIIEFKEKIIEKYNEPFEIIEYNGSSKPGKFRCGYCKQEYSLSRMNKLLSVNRKHLCSHCFSSQYAEKVLDYFTIKSDLSFYQFGYKKNLHKPTVIYKCNLCNELTEKPYVEFLKYPTCIHCGDNAKRRNNNTIIALIPTEFEILEEYEDQYSKKLFRHKKCNFIFKVRPKDLITGHTYCPKCSKKASKGERKIMDYLDTNGVQYQKEKIFDWSQYRRYDFYLPDYNLLIEYNGIQHYKEVPNFQIPLDEQQRIDEWKQNQAIMHNYNYFIISYLQFNNIEQLLAQRLKEAT